jgi:hypothetical protein
VADGHVEEVGTTRIGKGGGAAPEDWIWLAGLAMIQSLSSPHRVCSTKKEERTCGDAKFFTLDRTYLVFALKKEHKQANKQSNLRACPMCTTTVSK